MNSQKDALQELNERVKEAYAELLEIAYARTENHKQANISLEQAIRITHEVTLKFLRENTFEQESARVILQS